MSDASRLMWGGTIWLEESLYRQLDPTLTEGGRRKLELLLAEIIVSLLVEQGMTREDAHVFLDFNISGAYLGPDTPIIVWPYDPEDEES